MADVQETSYREKLLKLRLFNFDERRIRADLVCMSRNFKGIDQTDSGKFFSLCQASSITRGHFMEVVLPHFKMDVRQYFFFSRYKYLECIS